MKLNIRSNETIFAEKLSLSKDEIEKAHLSMIKSTAATERALGCREVLIADAGWEIRIETRRIKLISYFVVRENDGTAYDPEGEWLVKGKCENCGKEHSTRMKARDLDFGQEYQFTCDCTWNVFSHPDDWEYMG